MGHCQAPPPVTSWLAGRACRAGRISNIPPKQALISALEGYQRIKGVHAKLIKSWNYGKSNRNANSNNIGIFNSLKRIFSLFCASINSIFDWLFSKAISIYLLIWTDDATPVGLDFDSVVMELQRGLKVGDSAFCWWLLSSPSLSCLEKINFVTHLVCSLGCSGDNKFINFSDISNFVSIFFNVLDDVLYGESRTLEDFFIQAEISGILLLCQSSPWSFLSLSRFRTFFWCYWSIIIDWDIAFIVILQVLMFLALFSCEFLSLPSFLLREAQEQHHVWLTPLKGRQGS